MHHTISIYQRPAQGSAFVRQYPIYRYRHRISAIGGFDTASCQITAPSRVSADLFLEQHLGAFVKVYADNPAMPCWEGFINRITTGDYTMSLDEMANRVKVQHTHPSLPTTNQITTAVNNTDSQALFGIKEDTLEFGMKWDNDDRADDLRDAALAARAWPQKSVTQGEPGVINLEMLGFYHTLEWETYTSTATTITTYSSWLTGVLLPALVNGATFFDNTITSEIDTNGGVRRYNERSGNRSVWEIISRMAEAGDGAIPWVIGLTPSRFSDGKRTLYYRAMNTDIEYTARLSDGHRPRNLYGRLVSPWDVRPDRGIRITDTLLAWNGLGDNPAESWISYVEYDAESQGVKWYSSDSTEVEAAFQLHHTSKATGKRFGAAPRLNSA